MIPINRENVRDVIIAVLCIAAAYGLFYLVGCRKPVPSPSLQSATTPKPEAIRLSGMEGEMKEQLLTLSEAADYLRIHYTTAWRLAKKHQLPGFYVASEWRFSKETLDAWIAQGGTKHQQRARLEPT